MTLLRRFRRLQNTSHILKFHGLLIGDPWSAVFTEVILHCGAWRFWVLKALSSNLKHAQRVKAAHHIPHENTVHNLQLETFGNSSPEPTVCAPASFGPKSKALWRPRKTKNGSSLSCGKSSGIPELTSES